MVTTRTIDVSPNDYRLNETYSVHCIVNFYEKKRSQALKTYIVAMTNIYDKRNPYSVHVK